MHLHQAVKVSSEDLPIPVFLLVSLLEQRLYVLRSLQVFVAQFVQALLVDSIRGKGKRKEHYEYEQPLEEIESLVQIFSRRGDLIVDPFGGSFTVAVACRKHGRRFVGCDLDERCVCLGRQRVAQAG